MKIRKAVFPAAGLGTRFLPATKSSPKEMLPLVDKPLIQYVVEEAKASNIRDVIIVTGRGKRAIEDHFDVSFELEHTLELKGKVKLLKQMRGISNMVNFCYVRQKEALGLGHAILCVEDLIDNEPFAVLLGDDIIDSKIPCLKQMIKIYEKHRCSIIAVQRVNTEDVQNYGIIKPKKIEDKIYQVLDLIEKPTPSQAPSNLAIIGRYILTPNIFKFLRKTNPGKGGEIQLTDGLKQLLNCEPIYAFEFDGKRYDAGDKLGFLKATVEFALKSPDLGEDFREYLSNLNF